MKSDVNQFVPAPRSAWEASDAPGESNQNGVIFASAARAEATAYTSDPIHNYGARGVRLFIANGVIGTTTLTVKIQNQNPANGAWVDVPDAVTAALSTDDSTSTLTIYPGIAETANIAVSDHLGHVWRVVATLNDGDTASVTFSIGAVYLK